MADSIPVTTSQSEDDMQREVIWSMRKYLLLLAVLAASVTYIAGMNPPGGFWETSNANHQAGDPILEGENKNRYQAFFYCNATSFVASLVIIILLLLSSRVMGKKWLRALKLAMLLDLLGLMGAYAAGSCRDTETSIIISVLVVLTSIYVTIHLAVFKFKIEPLEECKQWCIKKIIQPVQEGIQWCHQKIKEKLPGPQNNDSRPIEPSADIAEEQHRKFTLFFAFFATTVTYQAGLSPPGGFWPDSGGDKHKPGDFVLREHYLARFKAFYCCNSVSFVVSLVTFLLILSRRLSKRGIQSNAVTICIGVNLLGLMGAYAAGSARDLSVSVYLITLAIATLAFIIIQVVFYKFSKANAAGTGNQEHSTSTESQPREQIRRSPLENSRTYILLLAILVASITYQAGLNPPGGWSLSGEAKGGEELHPGNAILQVTSNLRYSAFFYCNSAAFMASLVIIIILQSKKIRADLLGYKALTSLLTVVTIGLMIAYAAASSSYISSAIYIIVLAAGFLLYFGIHIFTFNFLPSKLKNSLDEWFEGQSSEQQDNAVESNEAERRRKALLVLAILAASVTYQAGLTPPGGFWDSAGHNIGEPVFQDEDKMHYEVFYYLTTTSFVTSLIIVMLLLRYRLNRKGIRTYALRFCMIVDLCSLMGSFAAGSSLQTKLSIYVLILVAIAFIFILLQVLIQIPIESVKIRRFLPAWFTKMLQPISPVQSSLHCPMADKGLVPCNKNSSDTCPTWPVRSLCRWKLSGITGI